MVEITKKGNGTCVGDRLYFGDDAQDGLITLALQKSEIMNYGQGNTNIVSFPGEYDIDDISIKCIDAWDVLHYIVYVDETWVALLQSSAALEKENIQWIDQWFVANEDIKKEIEGMDLEGDIIVME